jgi:hypothetical protein
MGKQPFDHERAIQCAQDSLTDSSIPMLEKRLMAYLFNNVELLRVQAHLDTIKNIVTEVWHPNPPSSSNPQIILLHLYRPSINALHLIGMM